MWGAEWQRTQDESAFFYHASGRHARNEHRLFSNLEWRAAPAWLWNLGYVLVLAAASWWAWTTVGPHLP